ncbi:unnamed protein product [Heligmosomoides polygyrus]|uniref:ANF_receptor domain-containing protein n=1 Tax=Heligmosomoides polygyrus TaxID=6339 RepID=A0A183FZ98_HELPZ|nr:unnamed protein product [Heligmosomoides polygyrus]
MHRLLFLAVFFCQKTNGVYGIDCATTSYEGSWTVSRMVGRELDGITNAPVDNPLEDLHVMRKQSDWTWMTVLIVDAKELLNILSLAMADLRESIKKSLAISSFLPLTSS